MASISSTEEARRMLWKLSRDRLCDKEQFEPEPSRLRLRRWWGATHGDDWVWGPTRWVLCGGGGRGGGGGTARLEFSKVHWSSWQSSGQSCRPDLFCVFNLNQQLQFWTLLNLYYFLLSLAYLLTESCSGWSAGNVGRGRNSPRPNDSWLWWSEFKGRGVAVGMWHASVSSRDALLLDNERSRGRRSLKPLGRPGGIPSRVAHNREKQKTFWGLKIFLLMFLFPDSLF